MRVCVCVGGWVAGWLGGWVAVWAARALWPFFFLLVKFLPRQPLLELRLPDQADTETHVLN